MRILSSMGGLLFLVFFAAGCTQILDYECRGRKALVQVPSSSMADRVYCPEGSHLEGSSLANRSLFLGGIRHQEWEITCVCDDEEDGGSSR